MTSSWAPQAGMMNQPMQGTNANVQMFQMSAKSSSTPLVVPSSGGWDDEWSGQWESSQKGVGPKGGSKGGKGSKGGEKKEDSAYDMTWLSKDEVRRRMQIEEPKLPKKPFRMACGNQDCVVLHHISLCSV